MCRAVAVQRTVAHLVKVDRAVLVASAGAVATARTPEGRDARARLFALATKGCVPAIELLAVRRPKHVALGVRRDPRNREGDVA